MFGLQVATLFLVCILWMEAGKPFSELFVCLILGWTVHFFYGQLQRARLARLLALEAKHKDRLEVSKALSEPIPKGTNICVHRYAHVDPDECDCICGCCEL